jgi:hypothetical protein
MVAMLRPRGTAGAARSPDEPGRQAASDTHVRIRGPLSRSVVVAWTPVIVFAFALAVTCGFNYRVTNNRSESPPWTAVVAAATKTCMKPGMGNYRYRHAWWQIKIPCGRVRSS